MNRTSLMTTKGKPYAIAHPSVRIDKGLAIPPWIPLAELCKEGEGDLLREGPALPTHVGEEDDLVLPNAG